MFLLLIISPRGDKSQPKIMGVVPGFTEIEYILPSIIVAEGGIERSLAYCRLRSCKHHECIIAFEFTGTAAAHRCAEDRTECEHLG